MPRPHQALSLQQASEESPQLANLMARARQSQVCLQTILPMLPLAMRPTLLAGPIDEAGWCILVKNNATAAKLRQLVPAMRERLRLQGQGPGAIRIKVLGGA